MTVAIDERPGGLSIRGSGGGKGAGAVSARTPIDQQGRLRNTAYAAVLDVISCGEVEGPVHPDAPLRDIYLDGTPIQNADGSLNFSNVHVEIRNGTIDQSHVPGFPAHADTTGVGVEVKFATPWVQSISNPDLSAVRVTVQIPQLVWNVQSGPQAGDRLGFQLPYAIDLAVGFGPFEEVLSTTIFDRIAGGYSRTHRIELPPSSDGWTVRVRRLTAEWTTSEVQDALYVQAYSEVIDGKFTHPMTALVGIKVDAEQFRSVPTRAYRWRGRRIRVPTNYDPITRTYSGSWNGTYKIAWSNNPAWVVHDILTNNLYGLGDRVDASMVDRYALYQIGAYCDQMVPDGKGGTEPRFVCNAYIQTEADALRLINDLCSIFRGSAYWDGQQATAVADMPSDPVYTFTNANVIDGRFEYTDADLSTIRTVALVQYNEPEIDYKSKIEVVRDLEGIQRYGVRRESYIAFGTTSRGQAQRVGLYQLYTSYMETNGVSFGVGLEGEIPRPGSIVRIADNLRAGRDVGGRIRQATTTSVTLDRDNEIKPGDILHVNLPSGQCESRTVTLVSDRVISVSPAFSVAPDPEAVWAVDADDLVTMHVRVISVTERGGIEFVIGGVQSDSRKHEAIDYGVRFDPLPTTVAPPRAQLAPENIVISEYHTFHQGTTRHFAQIVWDEAPHAVTYDVQWRRDGSDWVTVPRTPQRLVTLSDIFAGLYEVRVRAINSLDSPSLWAHAEPTELDGLAGEPPALASLTTTGEVMAIRLDWIYPSGPNIIEKIQIRSSLDNDFANSTFLTELAYPTRTYTLYGLGYSTEMWFWARLIDKNGEPGAWYPSEAGAGIYGIPDQDAANILSYLEGQIGEGQLAPGLIEEIGEGVTEEVMESILGDLTGDDVLDEKWFAGDDDSHFVGTVTTTSAYNAGDYAEAKRTTALAASMGSSLAVIREEMSVVANESSATAQMVLQLASTVGSMESVVEQTALAVSDLDGALHASWQVRTQVRSDGRVVQAGVALGASVDPGGTARSEFIVRADTIAFVNSLNGTLHAPFVFDTVNDTVFLANAFIGNASIGAAKLADWLESTATGPGGVPVLRLNFRTGEIQINSPMTGGGRLSLTNQLIRVFDGNNVLRVRMGIW